MYSEKERKIRVVIFFLLDYVWERVLGNQYVRIVLINDGSVVPYCPVNASRDSWHQYYSHAVSVMQRIWMISVLVISTEGDKKRKYALKEEKRKGQ